MKLLLALLLLIDMSSCVKWSAHYYDNGTCIEVIQNVCAKCYYDDVFYQIECGYSSKTMTSFDREHDQKIYKTDCVYKYYSDNKCLNKIKEVYPKYSLVHGKRVEKCSDIQSEHCDFYVVDNGVYDETKGIISLIFIVHFIIIVTVWDNVFQKYEKLLKKVKYETLREILRSTMLFFLIPLILLNPFIIYTATQSNDILEIILILIVPLAVVMLIIFFLVSFFMILDRVLGISAEHERNRNNWNRSRSGRRWWFDTGRLFM